MRNLFPSVPLVSLQQFSVSPPVTNEKLFNRIRAASKAIFNPSTPTQNQQQEQQHKHLQLQQSSYYILLAIIEKTSVYLLGFLDVVLLAAHLRLIILNAVISKTFRHLDAYEK